MADLTIDYDELDRARIDIDNAASTFSRADRVSSDIAGLVGHGGLAGKVNEFADSWDISRGKLQDSLEFIADSLQAVVDTFTELDSKQAGALTNGGGGGR